MESMQRLCGTPYDRVDAAWLRFRAAIRIAPISSAWSRPDLWVRHSLGLDPQRLTASDAECACTAIDHALARVQAARKPGAPAAAGTP